MSTQRGKMYNVFTKYNHSVQLCILCTQIACILYVDSIPLCTWTLDQTASMYKKTTTGNKIVIWVELNRTES